MNLTLSDRLYVLFCLLVIAVSAAVIVVGLLVQRLPRVEPEQIRQIVTMVKLWQM